LWRDWEAHGEYVIAQVRQDDPVAYFKGILALQPKYVSYWDNLPADAELGSMTAADEFLDRVTGQPGDTEGVMDESMPGCRIEGNQES
jgi:hypothetical protein